MNRKLYVMCGGALFAILQFSYYLQMEWLMSSTWITYSTVVVAWLIGAIVGLGYALENGWFGAIMLAVNILAFYSMRLGLYLRPFDNRLLPIYAIMIAISGAYVGLFMRANFKTMVGARELLLHENNGFILGLLISFLGFFLKGDIFSIAAPGACALLLLGFGIMMRR